MDLHRKVFCIVLLTLSINTKVSSHGAPADGSVINTELTGQELIRMGNVMNKPLLSLLGATIVKTKQNVKNELSERIGATEKKLQNGIDKLTLDALKGREILKMELCKQIRCAVWTEWSHCSVINTRNFGVRTRSRKCGGNTSICSPKLTETVETDYKICQGKTTCMHSLTDNNYCFKLYKSVPKTQKDAKEDCHKDGGHLMNIDSAQKARDMLDYFKNISFSSYVWIDGTRTLPKGHWKYAYGSKDINFSIWQSGEPGSTDDCNVFKISIGKWKGRPCKDTYYYLCEII